MTRSPCLSEHASGEHVLCAKPATRVCRLCVHHRIRDANASDYHPWYSQGVNGRTDFDVLVIGSGASGLAAAVSAGRAGARVALATKGSVQACNSAKAQGGIQAAFGEDDSPEQHAADVWKSSHESADMRLVEALTGDAQGAIHWLEELGVEFTRDNGGYRLARPA